jgi:S-DNA-T family DNA segregation ATPase FtsK/SpoIIIE
MRIGDKSGAVRSADNPLPPQIAALLRESWWLAIVVVALYLALILFTFDKADPGWSHSSSVEHIRNSGGRFGAWLSDILLFVFGLSAWWWVVLCAFVVRWSFRRIENVTAADRRSYAVAGVGFAILLTASASMEALRFYTIKATLPLAPGGMLGAGLSGLLSSAMGFTGATLVLLAMMAIGLSLFTGLSWIALLESFGGGLESAYHFTRQKWANWQDRRAGAVAVIERTEIVQESKKKLEIHEPLRIEPA